MIQMIMERYWQFVVEQCLSIISTNFCHKIILKETWKVPVTNIVNRIDHMLVSKRHVLYVTEVRTTKMSNFHFDQVKVVTEEYRL